MCRREAQSARSGFRWSQSVFVCRTASKQYWQFDRQFPMNGHKSAPLWNKASGGIPFCPGRIDRRSGHRILARRLASIPGEVVGSSNPCAFGSSQHFGDRGRGLTACGHMTVCGQRPVPPDTDLEFRGTGPTFSCFTRCARNGARLGLLCGPQLTPVRRLIQKA